MGMRNRRDRLCSSLFAYRELPQSRAVVNSVCAPWTAEANRPVMVMLPLGAQLQHELSHWPRRYGYSEVLA